MGSVANPDPGDPGSGALLTPESGTRDEIFPDPGYQTHVSESLVAMFKKRKIPRYLSYLPIGSKIFVPLKKIVFNFVKFLARKKVETKIFFPFLFLFSLDSGSGIRDPESRIQDGGKYGSWIQDKHFGSATLHLGIGILLLFAIFWR